MRIKIFIFVWLMFQTISLATIVSTSEIIEVDGEELILYNQGGQISDVPNYDWWYGCSPTATGMIIGYYDRNNFDNLVPNGDAELNSFPSIPGNWDYLAQSMIASLEHVIDFYSGGYGVSGDDIPSHHNFNSLADFMGTSQDNLSSQFGGNSNGSTSFWNYTNNSPLFENDIFGYGFDYYNISGMYGIGEYFEYAGYDLETLYNQRIYGYDGISAGFTFEQYMAEIDADRPVMIHVEGHSMLGYGYVNGTNTINIFDTWNPSPRTMVWGGSYAYGIYNLTHFGVTVMTPIPEPITLVLLSLGSLIFFVRKRG